MRIRHAILLALALAACGNQTDTTSSTQPNPQPSATQPSTAPSRANTAPSIAPSPSTTNAAQAAGAQAAGAQAAAQTALVAPNADGDYLASEAVAGLLPLRAVVARDVVERSPVDEGAAFPSNYDGRLYAFIELDNPSRATSKLRVYWQRPNGTRHGEVTLDVGAQPKWRTWAYTAHARTPGTWTAVFETESGELLAKKQFVIE